MSTINTGGPAFARSGFYDADGKSEHDTFPEDGMTLRDWFAGKAMQSALVTSKAEDEAGLLNLFPVVAKYSYLMADAMIAAREGGAS